MKTHAARGLTALLTFASAFLLGWGATLGTSATATTVDSVSLRVIDDEGRALDGVLLALMPNDAVQGTTIKNALIDQQERQFVPRAVPVQAGALVEFPNSDDIRHHVYSFSAAKPFEIKLYHGEEAEPVRFDKPGLVVLGCNIHDDMVGYLRVVDTPWFATSDAEGKARIRAVPQAGYTLELWHPDLGEQVIRRPFNVTAGMGEAEIRLEELEGRDSEALPPRDSEPHPLQALFREEG